MKICKSCGTILDDSFALGKTCSSCGIKIVYEEIEKPSLLENIGSWLKNAGMAVAACIGIALIGMWLWGLITMPFDLYKSEKYGRVRGSYHNIVIEIEQNLSLNNTEQAVAELEAYVIKHKKEFENFAENHEALEDGVLFQWVIMPTGPGVKGTAAKYIVDNKHKFKNKDVMELFQRIGFFHTTTSN